MKILLFVRSLGIGGTERQVGILARGLAELGHDIILVQFYPSGAMAASLAGSKVRLVTVGKTGRWDILGPLSRLRRLFRTERPDVIYAFLPMQNVLAALFESGLNAGALNFRCTRQRYAAQSL